MALAYMAKTLTVERHEERPVEAHASERVAIEMKTIETSYNKYAALHDTSLNLVPEKSIFSDLYEVVFGKSSDSREFENRHLTSKKKFKLGAIASSELTGSWRFTWVGSIYMG